MARSKRTHSSQPKGPRRITKERKLGLIENIRTLLKTHSHVYLFRLENPRSVFFQRIRRDLSGTSTFWLGKNKVLQKALGKTEAEEVVPGIYRVAELIKNNVGLLISKLARGELEDALAGYDFCDHARAGSTVNYQVKVAVNERGLLARQDSEEPVSASSEPTLRAAGMPTMLRGGSVLLAEGKEYVVCEAGAKLTDNQAKVLRIFGIKTDDFNVRLLARFDVDSGKLEQL